MNASGKRSPDRVLAERLQLAVGLAPLLGRLGELCDRRLLGRRRRETRVDGDRRDERVVADVAAARAMRLAHDARHVAARVDDGVEAAPAERVEVAVAVAAQLLDIREELGPRLAAVEERHLVTVVERGVDDMTTEELRPAEHEHAHYAHPMHIRHAEPSDYGAVIGVVDQWWGGRPMAAMLPKLFFVHFRDTSFVLDDDGEIAGFLCGFRSQTHADEAYIHFVGVDPGRRGAGVARALYERFFDGGRAADDRPRGHGAGQRALGRVPSRARLRDRAGRRGLRRARRGPRASRQAAGRRLPKTPFSGMPSAGRAGHDAAVGVPVYRGEFGVPQAERLLWRAGFGPRRGEAEALAKLGLHDAVHSLLYPGLEHLVGPKPHDSNGHPLAPADAWGHDHCWWLDRMVRTSRPLVERMALVWHDWFATSNAGVGSQKLMLAQNQLFRNHGLGSFQKLLLDVTKDPAMLLWLNGTQNEKGSPNENYGREMMELFTLGADRGAYTERDVREQARSLTGWRNNWKPGVGDYNFHLDPDAARRRHEDGLPQARPLRLADRLQALHLAPAAPVVLRQQALVVLRPDHARPRDGGGADRDLPQRLAGQAGRAGDPRASRALRRPAHGEAADRAPGRSAAPHRRGDHDHRLGLDRVAVRASSSSIRRTSPGWDDTRWLDTATFRGRWIAVERILQDRKLDPSKGKKAMDADTVLRRALAFWNKPPLADATHAALMHFARAALGDAGQGHLEAAAVPGARRERAAPVDRHLTGPADVMTKSNIVCDECTRADALRAVAGQGLPSIEPGMPTPAGTGLSRRSFVARSVGLALSVYGAGRLQFFDEGIAAAATRARAARARLGVPAGRRGCALAALSGRRPAVPQAAHRPRADRRHAVRRGLAADVAPGARADRPAVRRGQGQRAAGGRLRPSRPVALHLPPLLGGGGDRPAAADRVDGALSRRCRDARQPVAGTVAHRVAAADARDREGAGRRDRRAEPVRLLGPRCVGPARDADARRDRDARSHPFERPVRAHRHRRHRARRHAAPPVAAVRSRGRGEAARRCRVPDRERLVPDEPAGPRGDGGGGAAAALRRAGGLRLVRHARGTDRCADACADDDGGVALRVPARSRGPRRGRPRADARLVGVRPAGAGERLGRHRPRRRRDRAS